MSEAQSEVVYAPVKEKGQAEFPPIRTAETRALIARKKEEDWRDVEDIRGMIETRDVLEFVAIRNMASALQESSDKLGNLPDLRGGYSREQAEQIFDEIISSPDRNLSQQQRKALERGRDVILDSIDEFNAWRDEHTEEDVYSLLGGRFAEADRSKLRIDTTRFPGAVVVEATDTETYQAIRGKETSLGFYSKDLGEGILKGRILVVNSSEAHKDIDRHEYQHFIFAEASKDVEFLPEVSERKIKREEEKTEKAYKKKKAKLENEKLDAELAIEKEYEDYGRVRSETSKRLNSAEAKLRELPILLATSRTAREAKYRTYPEGPIRGAFTKFRNEFMAYTSSDGSKRVRFEVYFGDSLKPAQDDPYFEIFQAEVDLLKGILTLAERKGISNDRLGYLVGSSRNMQQAAKFVYLETQMDEIQSELAKTAQPKEPHKKEINLEALSKGFNETAFTGDEIDD